MQMWICKCQNSASFLGILYLLAKKKQHNFCVWTRFTRTCFNTKNNLCWFNDCFHCRGAVHRWHVSVYFWNTNIFVDSSEFVIQKWGNTCRKNREKNVVSQNYKLLNAHDLLLENSLNFVYFSLKCFQIHRLMMLTYYFNCLTNLITKNLKNPNYDII